MTLVTAPLVHTASCWDRNPPVPPGPTGDVEFSYNPQDEFVMAPATIVVNDVGQGPTVEKAKVGGGAPAAVNDKYVYPTSDARYHTANAFSATANTIAIFESYLGEPIPWAFRGPQLEVNGDGGEMLNAYYSRNDGSINFFHHRDKVTGGMIYSGDSGEVVAHETGHAILDGLRPSYLRTWSPDPGGFHESFGDVLAMLISLRDDSVVAKVLEETGGDLTRPNAAAHLGEQLGIAINNETGRNQTGGNYTRTAINNFTWQDPSTLPGSAPHDQLSRQVHSYSRLWTGAFYDVFRGMVADYKAQGQDDAAALKSAADEGLRLYGGLMKTAPHGDHAYRDMAVALLQADSRSNGGKRSELIRNVMTERRILSPSASLDAEIAGPIPTGELRELQTTLKGGQFGQFEGAVVRTEVDAHRSLTEDGQRAAKLEQDVQALIDAGRILYTTPGQQLKPEDYFDKDGTPYMGIVRWESGQMEIERSPILS